MAKKTKTPTKPTTTKSGKAAPKAKGDATEKARKDAIAQIDARLAEQDVPTAKERANNAANEAHGKAKGRGARGKPKDAAGANVAADAGKGEGDRPAKRVSALDAAATVLGEAPAEGMGAKDLIAELKTRGLWSSPGGKTPSATLYAAILREINAKGEQARFKKVGRGALRPGRPLAGSAHPSLDPPPAPPAPGRGFSSPVPPAGKETIVSYRTGQGNERFLA